MALAFQSGESIKQALFEELQNILSPVTEVRTGAENRMKHLEFTEGIARMHSPFTQMLKIVEWLVFQVMASIWPNS